MLRFLNRNREGVIGLALIAGLFVLGLRHFLFAHAVAETFSIVIAASIFLFVWNARRFLDNDYLFFLGVGYLFVGIVDFMHMITYKGMGVLSVPAPNVSTQLWVAGRYMEALIFLCAPLCARGRVWAVAPFAGFAALTGLAFLSILVWQNFPACYVEGEGLTAFKEASEWGIAAVLTAAMALLWYRRAFFDAAVFRWIQCALATTVVSEILFSRYVSVYDHTNLLGHMLKVASYYFVYKAIVEKGLSRPYDLLFRNLKQSENELRWYRDRLEGLVRERTAQLESSKVSLEKEVAERSRIQDELKMRNVLLKLLSKSGSRREYLESVVRLLKGWTRCENVAIRLIVAGKELVFGAWRGFDHAFCAAEAHLFLDRDLCVCTRVFKEEPEAVESSFMTPHGSFYCEDMERFFNTLPAHALPRFRGACRSAGFVFVAITPIRYGDHIIGLIHFADRKGHPGLQKKVAAIEVVTSVVGEGVRKFELEERIKRESATLEGFFAHTITPLVILDKDFNFVRVNEAYAKACQRRPGDFVGRNHFELYPSAENELIFREVVRTKTPHQAFAKAFLFPDHPEWGTTYWNWTLVPMLDDSGAVECLVFSLNDVTAVTRAREELRRKERELADARRLADVGTLAATVAHELRNPLAAIRMAAYNIRRKAANPALSGHLENIEAKIEDSEQIITNLLFYSRMRPPVFAPVALESLLEECLREVEHRHGNNGAAVLRRFEDLADVTIEADAVQMKELFSNLLNNAFEALEGGKGMVEVAAGRENNMLRVAVRDSGRGIAAHNLERIFEPFFSDKARGTGLGLTVSRQIAVFHGGEIRVASREGAGTTVTVSLPIERGGVHGR